MNSSTMFAAAWIVISEIIASPTLGATLKTDAHSVVCSTMNLEAGMEIDHFFQTNLDFVYSIMMVATSWKTQVTGVHSI